MAEEVKRKKAKSGGSDRDTGPVYRHKDKQKLLGDSLKNDEVKDLDRRQLKKRKRMVYNRSTGKHEPDTARQSPGMGYVIKDILHRVTRGGLKTKKRTDKAVKEAGG